MTPALGVPLTRSDRVAFFAGEGMLVVGPRSGRFSIPACLGGVRFCLVMPYSAVQCRRGRTLNCCIRPYLHNEVQCGRGNDLRPNHTDMQGPSTEDLPKMFTVPLAFHYILHVVSIPSFV